MAVIILFAVCTIALAIACTYMMIKEMLDGPLSCSEDDIWNIILDGVEWMPVAISTLALYILHFF